ncbi:MAG: putative pre-16S rRNA nuclease [Candidatus Marinimicrobia bacterium]|nr:putative pre-16S rRNA nuclease [Candidatus Neomarinimicrobiota bacterium]
MSMPGRILALDYGAKKVGVATTDPLQITASPLQTVRYHARDDLLKAINEIIGEKEPVLIVVGVPYTLDGGKSAFTEEVEEFITWLKENIEVPITTLDERYTSEDAKATLIEMGIKTGHNKEKVDAMAASHLLRFYLDSRSGENQS